MQNKHQQFFLVVGVPTFGEGGGAKPVGTKSQVCPKKLLDGSPKNVGKNQSSNHFNACLISEKHFFPRTNRHHCSHPSSYNFQMGIAHLALALSEHPGVSEEIRVVRRENW